MNILFICNQNQNRSRTAEELFRDRFSTRSASLYNPTPVSRDQLAWADVIIVMEDSHRTELAKRFPNLYLKKRIISLDILDIYFYGQPELINELEMRMGELCPPLIE